jgi:hypothetical protein
MQWRYDQRLVETVVFREAQRLEAAGDHAKAQRYHQRVDVAYARDVSEREQAFFDAHWQLFREYACDLPLTEVAQEFPYVQAQVERGVVTATMSARDELADLFVDDHGERIVLMRLRADRYTDIEALRAFVRHELAHIDDMLDPAFAYDKNCIDDLEHSIAARVTRDRYRLLWAISIDSRSTRAGHVSLYTRAQRFAEFCVLFRFIQEQDALVQFSQLWDEPRPTHAAFMALAREPRTTMQQGVTGPGASVLHLGQPCPLCQFPSHAWAEVDALPEEILQMVRAEFPTWTPAQGLCDRCAEVYTVQQHAC